MTISWHHTLWRTPLLCILCGLAVLTGNPAHSQDTSRLETIRQELDGAVNLLLDNRSRASGQIVQWDGRELRLAVTLDAGQAEMTFAAEDIREIRFPGGEYLEQLHQWMEDPEHADKALELFQAFWEQREAYLPYLSSAELNLFLEYVRFALEQGQPDRAITLVEALRPRIEDERQIESLDNALLLASFQTRRHEEAARRAEAWIEQSQPAGASALGWRILAELHFQKESYEASLWTALYPIAFANQILPEYLDVCYAFAVAAATETRQKDLADRLANEMQQRGLNWPVELTLLEAYQPQALEPDPESTDEELLEPLQTPSPRDPLQSLPTRIRQTGFERDEG